MFRIFSQLRKYHQIKNIQQFNSLTKQSKIPYIINFTASWCGPCKIMSPMLIKRQKTYQGKFKLIRIDVDQEGNAQICQKYQLVGVPTIIFVKDGKNINKIVGAVDQTKLDQAIKSIL